MIIKEEAKIVKTIYSMFLDGTGTPSIANKLNEKGYKTKQGNSWGPSGVRKVLMNVIYTGDLILQSTYKNNHIEKKKIINNGVLPKYIVEDAHEPIIDKETFNKVQEEIKRRADLMNFNPNKVRSFCFTGKLICEQCGKHYRRKVTPYNKYWICGAFSMKGKQFCSSKQIPKQLLMNAISEVLNIKEFKEEYFVSLVENVTICNGNKIVVNFKDNANKAVY